MLRSVRGPAVAEVQLPPSSTKGALRRLHGSLSTPALLSGGKSFRSSAKVGLLGQHVCVYVCVSVCVCVCVCLCLCLCLCACVAVGSYVWLWLCVTSGLPRFRPLSLGTASVISSPKLWRRAAKFHESGRMRICTSWYVQTCSG